MSFMGGKKVLFVCIENAGRSKMAESFFKKHAPESFQALSAGTKPASHLNPVVVKAMREVGIELSGKPKTLASKNLTSSFRIINMGCMDGESCPALSVGEVDDWDIPDPKGKTLEEVRVIRNQIEFKVRELLVQLKK